MARIRTIKPGFWKDQKISKFKRDVRLMFIGLWNLADDEGIIHGDPAVIKSELFAFDEDLKISTVTTWVEQLIQARMIIPFVYNDENYYYIRTFKNHQTINRPQSSRIPKDVIHGLFTEHSLNNTGTFTAGKEGKGKEEEKEGKRKGVFTPSAEMELTDMDVNKAIEYLSITKHIQATRDMILSIWSVFKTKNFGGEKNYKDESEVRGHFFNALKYENIKQEYGKVTKGNFGTKSVSKGRVDEGRFGQP